ncbi:MAG: hypothetical protein R8J94_20335 [Acidimicrobiia bacterium]|nr:hypothetical protein [Acidimicrobiia bacterium]
MEISRRRCLVLAAWSVIGAACGGTEDTRTDWNRVDVFIVVSHIPEGTPADVAIESNSFGLKTVVATQRASTAIANLGSLQGEALRDFAPNTILVEGMFAVIDQEQS